MTMEAILSGPAGYGLVTEGEQAWLIHWNRPGEFQTINAVQANPLFQGQEGKVRRFTVKQPQEAWQRLVQLRRQVQAHDHLVAMLDIHLDENVRLDHVLTVEQLLQDPSIWDHLAGILYSQALPDINACLLATELAKKSQAIHVADLLQEVIHCQATIIQARDAWEKIEENLFPQAMDRSLYWQTMVDNGLFYAFVQALRDGHADAFQFRAIQLLQKFPNYRQIVMAWTTPLSHGHHKHEIPHKETKSPPLPREKNRKEFRNRGDIYSKVNKIKETIIGLFKIRPLPERKLELLLDGLRTLQNQGDKSYLAKSMTDLAVRAREAHLPRLHLCLAQEAVEVHETDGLAWAVLATAYRIQGNLPESLQASQRAMEFGSSIFIGLKEYAATLKAMNRLEEALAAYEEVTLQFPDDVVAQTGRADILKAMHLFDEALTVYDEVLRLVPDEIILLNGRGDTLKLMNCLDEALIAYNGTIEEFPDNVVAKIGRAETLKLMNRFDEALAAFQEILAQCPDHACAHIGYTDTLKALNRVY